MAAGGLFPIRALVAALAILAIAVPAASASSIVYIKDGNVWLAAPDGTRQTQLTTDGGYQSPSQADDGTIVAIREAPAGQRRIHRMNRAGALLNPPSEGPSATNSNFTGPLGAEVSPDGQLVAYHFFNSGSVTFPERPRWALARSYENTDPAAIHSQGYYLNPTWFGNNKTILVNHTGSNVDLYTLGGSYQPWFSPPDSIGQPDLSSDGLRFAATVDAGAKLRLYTLASPPPTPPDAAACEFTGANGGAFASPTWSPDGQQLAWAEGDGIYVTVVRGVATCDVDIVSTPVIPGGSSPSWGPADAPLPVVGGGGGGGGGAPGGGEAADTTPPQISTSASKPRLGKALRKGLTVRVATNEGGTAVVQGVAGGKVVAKGLATVPGAGTHPVKAKFTRKARRKYRRARRLKVTLRTTVTDAAGNPAVTSMKLTLKR